MSLSVVKYEGTTAAAKPTRLVQLAPGEIAVVPSDTMVVREDGEPGELAAAEVGEIVVVGRFIGTVAA